MLDDSVVASSEVMTQNEAKGLDMSERTRALLAKYGIENVADNPEFDLESAMIEFEVSVEEIQSIKNHYREYMESLESAGPANLSLNAGALSKSIIGPETVDATTPDGVKTLERLQALIEKYGIENVVNNLEFDLESAMVEFGISEEDIESFK